MSTDTNRFVTFDAVLPSGRVEEQMFHIRSSEIPTLADGHVLIRPAAFSIDPVQRILLSGGSDEMLPQHIPGRPIVGDAVGRVIESRHPDFTPGTVVAGRLQWADTALWPADGDLFGLSVIDPGITELSYALGIYGIVGLTAFFGITEVARVAAGETVLVSAAAGAVGSIAGQIARLRGARVIGLTSSQSKRDVLTGQLGFDAALDYRAADFPEQLRAVAPGGPDLYFDNVGGAVSQQVMHQMRRPARIVECGQISTYGDSGTAWTVDITPIHLNGLRFEGFTPALFIEQWTDARAKLAEWVHGGRLIPLETRMTGLASLPAALVALFEGKNLGKLVVTVD